MSGRRAIVFFAIGEPTILRWEAGTMRSESKFRMHSNIQMSDYCRDWNKSNSDSGNERYKSEISNILQVYPFHFTLLNQMYIYIYIIII